MSQFLIKHFNREKTLLNVKTIDAKPGEDIGGYTESQMAVRCGFNFTVNSGERITYELCQTKEG